MQYPRDDPGFERVATLDIETTHVKLAMGEIVSVGRGVHDRGAEGNAATDDHFYREGSGEAGLG